MKRQHRNSVANVYFAEEIKKPFITLGALITGFVFAVICIIVLVSIGYYSETTVTESEYNIEREIILSGVQQLIEGNVKEKEMTLEVIRLSKEYYLSKIANYPGKRDIQDRCLNKNELCAFWAANGQCYIKYEYMEAHCPLACQTCEENSKIGQFNVGVPQVVGTNVTEAKEVREVIRLSKEYYLGEIANNPQKSDFKDKCTNKESRCSYWAATGQCEIHYIYMESNCPLACRKCSS